MRNKLYARYENLYNEAMEEGANMQAKSVLDSMVKLGQLDRPKPVVQITPDEKEGGKITINFGFDNGD